MVPRKQARWCWASVALGLVGGEAGPSPGDVRIAHAAPPSAPAHVETPTPVPTSTASVPTLGDAPANVDPNDDDTVAPPDAIADCDARLKRAGVKFRSASLPVTRQAGGFDCGAPQVVVYERGPTGATWGGPIVTCGVALGMARFEGIVQEEAQRFFAAKLRRVETAGSYSCRKMVRFRLVSEHSYANAIDVRAFELDNGKRITVEQSFGVPSAPPANEAARFLRASAERAFDENAFSVVLTPHFDALHRDHFHLDQAHYRTNGAR